MKFFITGDCHGEFTRFNTLPTDEEIGVIILGDAGFNFYLNKTDEKKKKEFCANYPNITVYCVRGNHEARPQDLETMATKFDTTVHGVVYTEPQYPNIRYFLDYGFYDISGYNCLVIGGAYSVDKNWRLIRNGMTEETNNPKKTGWFANEQLTKEEMKDCYELARNFNKKVDFVFTHTCPTKFQPTDMFLHGIDQSKVDNSMEEFLEIISYQIGWETWCFGHYHADRVERPHVEQYYRDIEELDELHDRWEKYDETHELPWHIVKGPMFDA